MSFVHLHLHSEYSMLDGLNRVQPLLEKVKQSGMSAVALTDHGVLYGVTEFWLGAKDQGVKPIIGCEIYLAPGKHTQKSAVDGVKYYHLLLLAKNKTGYANLNKIVSISHLEGMYYKPRVDLETLAKHSEGLICTSACLAGPISRHILRKQDDKAEFYLKALYQIFGEDFYLEVQRNGFANTDQWEDRFGENISAEHVRTIQEQMLVNTRLREYGEKMNIPVITTTDAHFLNKDDDTTQEVLFAIKDGRLLTDPKRRMGYLDTYVKTPDEMDHHFEDAPEIITNTIEVAEKVETYDITFDRIQPKYITFKKSEQGKTTQELLAEQTFAGAKEVYKNVDEALTERIKYELKVIHEKGYDDYFLVVSDIIKWARSQGIVVGVRGSVAGSVVAYCLDIINVEPLGWELYFERFLNPERPSPPDIDMDFQDDRRDEVIKYVEEKYGRENVASICAIGRMKTKAAIRDVGRVMAIDLKVTDKLSKMVHVIFGKVKPIKKMMDEDPEFAGIINSSAELQKLKTVVSKIEGMARHVSTHACGYLITPSPITDYVAVQLESGSNSTKVITQQEGAWIETLGLMKFDFLGLRNLTIIKNTLDLIEKYHGVNIDTKKIPLDDKKTFALFGRGETIGVFQFESPPMQKYLRDLRPETLEDLCFMVSAYRPGPMKYIPEYIDCRHGRKQPTYLIPEMKPILEKTFGFAIYQEQVIKIAVDIAGYSMGQADLLRRAMGKKKLDVMKKEEIVFKKGVMEKGYDDAIASQIWEYLLPFADYGFNKAHGASYALVAYWCAYLKANYPIEFMTGLMHSDISDSDRIAIDMAEARRMNFTILPPDINKSETYFTIEKGKYIRFGLGAVKGVGMQAVEYIVNERQQNGDYKNFDDFVARIIAGKLNKKVVECLVKIGALDRFGHRNQLLAALPQIFEREANSHKVKSIGQTDIFGMAINASDGSVGMIMQLTPLPDLADVDIAQKIEWEKELIGSYITAHPLDKYQALTLDGSIQQASVLVQEGAVTLFRANQKYRFLANINSIRTLLTKNGNKPMAILLLEDQYAKAEAVVFPKTYELIKAKLVAGVAVISGNVQERDDKLNLIVDDIFPAPDPDDVSNIKIDLRRSTDKKELADLKKTIVMYKGGNTRLDIIYGDQSSPKTITTTIKPDPELLRSLNKYLVRNY